MDDPPAHDDATPEGTGKSPATPGPETDPTPRAGDGPGSRRARDLDRQSYRRSGPEEIATRATLYVVRGLFFLASAGVGYYASVAFKTPDRLLVCLLTGCALGLGVMLGEVFFSKAPVRTLASILFGLIMGLAISLFFQPVVVLIVNSVAPEGEFTSNLIGFLQLVTTILFCYFGVTVLLQTKDEFKFIIPYVEFRKELRGHMPLVMDTSSIIDGRVASLLETQVLDHRLVMPRYALDELQMIADSPDRSRRERGRRGLDVVHELQESHGLEILERDAPAGVEVDAALVELTRELRGKLLTTDFNLQKRAEVQGIPVINLHDIATALKPVVVAGEALTVELLRHGDDEGQAVGFLDDGTMVVVENASRQIGREVKVEVTSSTQTPVGKMVFGRLARGAGPRRPRKPRRDRGRGGGS